MRSSFVFAALLCAAPASSLACSCWGTQSIGNALTTADAVIVGRVRSHKEASYTLENQRPAFIDVEVVESLKGSLIGKVEIAKTLMCYQSFPEDDFQVGKTYVFPLEQVDLANSDESFGLMIHTNSPVPSYKMFKLPVCSHNGLLLDSNGLYTSELTGSGGRKLEYYMPLTLVKVLLPVGLLSVWGITVWAAFAVALAVTIVVIRMRRRKSRHGV